MFLIICTSGAQTLYNDVGHIPSSHKLKWHNAGLLKDCNSITPKLVINVNDFSGDDYDQTMSALDSARSHVNDTEGLAIIYFPEGTYSLDSTITLHYPDSNIVFQGEGSDKSILKFNNNATKGVNYDCFKFQDLGWSTEVSINGDLYKGKSKIRVIPPMTGLSNEAWVQFFKPDFDFHSQNSSPIYDAVGQISQIINIIGTDTIVIKDEANLTYYDDTPNISTLKIRSFTPIRNIGIEDLTIERNDKYTLAESGTWNFEIAGAVNCWIRGVESNFTSRNHLTISRSAHMEISGCYFHEAADYGGDGKGYGVQLYASATNCLVENNVFRKLRHALVAAAGSNCNVWTFNYSREQNGTDTERDLDLHAKYPFGHLFEQNVVERIGADDHHGENGPYNAFIRNHVYTGDIVAKEMDDWSSLGNISNLNPQYAPAHDYTYSASMDRYGYINNYTTYKTHNMVAYYPSDGDDCRLQDISYYYSERPYFLSTSYTWPAVGAQVTSASLTQSIPAKARWNDTKKTYNIYPTSHSQTTSGSLTEDERWSGTIACTDDVTVPAGVTLTIDPGATVTFPASKKLRIYGTLVAEGTELSDIEFDCATSGSKWSGLWFENGSSGDLEYCTINNAAYGVYGKQGTPSVSNCTFVNNIYALRTYQGNWSGKPFQNNIMQGGTNGIHISQSTYLTIDECTIDGPSYYGLRASSANYTNEVLNCNIKDVTKDGVYLYNSDLTFEFNDIHSNGEEGVYMYGGSDPSFYDFGGNNIVANNDLWGIYINTGCVPILGSSYASTGDGNSYYGNGSGELYSVGSDVINARNNYWGQVYGDTTLIPVSGPNFMTNPQLPLNPNMRSLQKMIVGDDKDSGDETAGILSAPIDSVALALFTKAHALQVAKKFDSAIPLYQQIIDEHPQSQQAEMSVIRLSRCYQRTEDKSEGKAIIISYTDNEESEDVSIAAQYEAGDWELDDGNIDAAIDYFTGVAHAQKTRSKEALLEVWHIHFNITGNEGQLKTLLKQYEKWYGVDENVIDMKLLMGLISVEEADKWFKEHANDELGKEAAQSAEDVLPTRFVLHENYPNPFNPVTRIDFELPSESHVKMEIFNILGQKVIVLVDRDMQAGRFTEKWDGQDRNGIKVGAGLYFCRFTAGEFSKTIKMTLLP